jgi:hypothetical protein
MPHNNHIEHICLGRSIAIGQSDFMRLTKTRVRKQHPFSRVLPIGPKPMWAGLQTLMALIGRSDVGNPCARE